MNEVEQAIKSMQNLDMVISITKSEHKAVKLAIEALKKQTPKKPTARLDSFFCSECGNLLNDNMLENYCSYCGQKIDWGE